MSSDPNLEEIQSIFPEIILPFYGERRDMYVVTEGGRAENDAEHSWSLAFMGFILAPILDKNLNLQKVLAYAIIHDLTEIYCGDTSVWSNRETLDTKDSREKESLQKMIKKFAKYKHFVSALRDYHEKVDNEAKFVYALDKLHNWLTAYSGGDLYYKKYNKITLEQAKAKLAERRAKAHTHSKIGRYYDQLTDLFMAHPENFYAGKK